ncbi:MAG: 5-(carboxyamino)imidazole ribonucleotide mutase [Candidatus Methanomethylophilus sp.]|jgi:5-(carboxyamino)imidazole ribonucleotide mutase|nr:5-(carboxyamino)imidazole ribonucleotide mutase [Methanomethylophilus sp.]MBQ4368626.1 5-(carboxyamino)imidazole ribonucleotide mutase [Methanomethylophilus sp.]MBQ5397463.1 5-(carboxyamino)imidazole ribonucleotide mutase [Methanomethylophilus sp.]MBQ5482752.1 5-(carboxyamino)imidazole ribonucleotide mutase [Methanomethylophilus sp.]
MAKVFIIMGSKSDFPIAEKAIKVLNKFGVAYDIAVASAHRTPQRVEQLVTGTDAGVFISIAGLSAALPGVVASFTTKPVIGVPVSGSLNYDALLSIVQMPPGIPVAAVGMDRGDNAATLAIEMLALSDPALAKKLADDRKAMAEKVEKDSDFVVGEAGKVQ